MILPTLVRPSCSGPGDIIIVILDGREAGGFGAALSSVGYTTATASTRGHQSYCKSNISGILLDYSGSLPDSMSHCSSPENNTIIWISLESHSLNCQARRIG